MYEVTQDYIDKATAAGRVYSVQLIIDIPPEEETTPPEENIDETPEEPEEPVDTSTVVGGADVLAMKIVFGQTTGGFSLGNTVCASLEASVANRVQVRVNDSIHVKVRFGEGENATEWQSLGRFYVDSIKQEQGNKKITAYDRMLQFGRIYESKLEYPAKVSAILQEISEQIGVPLSKSINLINDAEITKKPQGYLIRDMLGYLAGINGGSAYIGPSEEIDISAPTETQYTIGAAQTMTQTEQDTDFMIKNFILNTSNRTISVGDHFSVNTVEINNPLSFSSADSVITNLKDNLGGLAYDTVTIKKQGMGIFQLGDLVNYAALDEKVYQMLVMGIVYDFTGGFFSETLYSLAQSASQQKNQGNRSVNLQDSMTTGGEAGGATGDFAYTTGIHFKPGGFDLDFITVNGDRATNSFAINTSGGRVTKIVNQTAGREIEVTY